MSTRAEIRTQPSYGHEDDWKHIDDVKFGAFDFGTDRSVEDPLIREQIVDVAILEGNPSGNLLQAAELLSVSNIEKVFTVWANTLLQCGERVLPMEGDFLTVGSQRWLIVTVIDAVFGTQYKCFCRRIKPAS